MNKIQKELYQAPELNAVELNHDLSILLSFSIEGNVDPIELGETDEINNYGRW